MPIWGEQLGSNSEVDGFRVQFRDGSSSNEFVQFRRFNSLICHRAAFRLVERHDVVLLCSFDNTTDCLPILGNRKSPQSGVSTSGIDKHLRDSNFRNHVGTGLVLISLARKGYVTSGFERDHSGDPYPVT